MGVAGLGALGNHLVSTLGQYGAGEVLLIDFDILETTNLDRSVIFRSPDCAGLLKADAAAAACRRLFPATRWTPLSVPIADVGWRPLAACNLIFCDVDRDSARLETARIATRLGLPVCDAGLATAPLNAGRVSWFPHSGACFCCRLRPAARASLLASWSSRALSCNMPASAPTWTSSPAMAAAIAGLQAELGLAWLFSNQSSALTLDLSLSPTPRLNQLSIPLSPACPFHHLPPGHLRWSPCPGVFADILAPGESAHFEWPICLTCRCLACLHEFQPRIRLPLLRASGRCPHCDSTNLLPLDSVAAIAHSSPLASSPPSILGLPPDHLYSIRKGIG